MKRMEPMEPDVRANLARQLVGVAILILAAGCASESPTGARTTPMTPCTTDLDCQENNPHLPPYGVFIRHPIVDDGTVRR